MPVIPGLTILAAAVAAAVLVAQHARVLRDQRRELLRARRARLQYEAALRLSGTLLTEEIYSGLRELVGSAVPCDGMIVSSYDDRTRTVRCSYLWVNGHRLDHATLPALSIDLEHGTGMQTEVIRAGEGRLFADVHQRIRRGGRYYDVAPDGTVRDASAPNPAPGGAHCAIMVPVKLEGSVVGIVQTMCDTPGAYTPEHLGILESLVAPMAVALQNAELYARAHREIAERTRVEGALKESEERLREADRRKDEFLATLAHELRNPLAPIRTAVALLRSDDVVRDKLPWCRDVIERQVGHMAHLLDDLLDVSRISRGTLRLRRERMDLTEVVRNALEASQHSIEAGGHDMNVVLPDRPIAVDGDATRLAQVVSNLLNNAARYSERGGRIDVTARVEGGHAMISVVDSGIGISPDMLGRIFEPFVQADRTLERSQGGLGIGLTLVKQVVEMHGGSVEAWSAGLGHGSRFEVHLPVAAEAAAPAPETNVPQPARVLCRRVLVVDDLKDSADAMALMLRAEGHEVHAAYDGLAAVEAARRLRPDVVLLDIGMPGLNGYETARRIRRECEGALLLVAITGWGHDDDRQRTKEAGFDHHLVKPVDPRAVADLLSLARAGAER